jgi:hypothetical protein
MREQTELLLTLGSPGTARVLADAEHALGALQRRSGSFDGFPRQARHESSDGLDEAGARERRSCFREPLAALPRSAEDYSFFGASPWGSAGAWGFGGRTRSSS